MSTTATFSIPSEIGSPADVLQALGAAFLVQQLADVAAEQVRISAEGSGFRIELRGADAPRRALEPIIPYFHAKDGEAMPVPNRGEVYDYAADKRKSEEKKAAEKVQGRKGRRSARKTEANPIEEQEDRGTPSRRWPLYSALQALTKGSFQDEWNQTWEILDQLTSTDATNLASEAWKHLRGLTDIPTLPADEITLGQHFNPSAAKGANRAKPDSVKRDNLSGKRFTEWLKMIGLDRIGIMRRVNDDVRVWVPIPADIGLDALLAAHTRFHVTPWRQGNVKQDILTALDFADALATHWLSKNAPPRRRASRTVRGVAVASFKNMGGGFNVMNVTAYGLPGWIVLDTLADLETYLLALENFRRAARCLDESHSDEISVLTSLREAIGAETARPLLDFFADYAVFAQRAGAHSRYASRFSVDGLDPVLEGASPMLSDIIRDEGFRNIATAIRKATVTEQFHKKNNRGVYEIHYGLFADLRRAGRKPGEFISRLSAFVSTYNAENARVSEAGREQGRPRARVSDADLDAIIRLVERHGSELVAHLLCAYGSATEKRDPSNSEPGHDNQEV